ncbi:Cx9C motif-containing protein [Actinidia chinensis var. chinensis]|uniref:Cx9C motif-containing protein n=1 Tax=Actinidia chinensis var. chinensis TaxID=1590841 RepID=A0A2R6PII3_ACTCC|nr:Cx9C motif-containing protein [Actinidia chinensis var. chinensis]
MDGSRTPQPICAQEALDLLNCVTESPLDQEKCLRLLHSLHECVQSKKVKKFTLAEQNKERVDSMSKKDG